MKKRLQLSINSILIGLLLIGCAPQGSVETTHSQEQLQQMYSDAAGKVQALQDFSIDVTIQKETAIGGHIFTEASRQQLSFLQYGQDTMQAAVEEGYQVGNHTVSLREHYADNKAALQIDGQGFTASLTAQAYLDRFVPTVLLDPVLYGSITLENIDGQQKLTFSNASAAESWTGASGYHITQATGTALINAEGMLTESSYRFTYPDGPAAITLQVTVKLVAEEAPALPEFPDITEYASIENMDAPKLLERATGHLLQANAVTSASKESITCQAGGLYREQNSNLDLYRLDTSLIAQLARTISLRDDGRGGTVTTDSQVEAFVKDLYTITANNGEPVVKEDVTAQHMLTYCQDMLVATILLPKYLTGVTVTDEGDAYRYTFTATNTLSDVLMSNACKALYNDPEVLNKLASAYVVNETTGYLVINKQTGLPTASGLYYSGTHTIAGADYLLAYALDHTYDLASQTAEGTITGQAPTAPPDTTGPSNPTNPA